MVLQINTPPHIVKVKPVYPRRFDEERSNRNGEDVHQGRLDQAARDKFSDKINERLVTLAKLRPRVAENVENILNSPARSLMIQVLSLPALDQLSPQERSSVISVASAKLFNFTFNYSKFKVSNLDRQNIKGLMDVVSTSYFQSPQSQLHNRRENFLICFFIFRRRMLKNSLFQEQTRIKVAAEIVIHQEGIGLQR